MRIWWQSMSSEAHATAYWPALRQQLQSYADPGTEIEVRGTRAGRLDQHRFFELLVTTSGLANAVSAERQGFDAMAIGNILDPGLRSVRAMIDIPVLGLGETAMMTAGLMGGKFSLVFVSQLFGPRILENARLYGFESRLAATDAIRSDPQLINRAFTDEAVKDECLADFQAAARRTIAAGAEVVIPAGGALVSLLEWAGLRSVERVPVLNALASLMKLTEATVRLRAVTGVFISRQGLYARPPADALDQAREAYRATYRIEDL
ncbi:MAG TPA: aspartate/glutamate racemase family protein [Dehalococcoidia bacterium]|nr:aspartate/glutamate racemase family protein [Dehalococcoidia bacterium]